MCQQQFHVPAFLFHCFSGFAPHPMSEPVMDTISGQIPDMAKEPRAEDEDEGKRPKDGSSVLPADEQTDVGVAAEPVQREDKGREEYAKGNYEEAAKAWAVALKSCKYIRDKGFYSSKPEQMEEVHQMEMRNNLNMAQCQLKLRDWAQAVSFADKALERDPRHAKGLYRKAVALKELSKFDEAITALENLLEEEPDNKAGQSLLPETRRAQQLYERKAREVSRKMIGGCGSGADRAGPEAGVSFRGGVLRRITGLLSFCPSRRPVSSGAEQRVR